MSQAVLTPTAGRALRRSLFWVGVALFTILIAVVSFAVAGSSSGGRPLDPANPAPEGAMAVAEVLRDRGVEVVATTSLVETRREIDDPARTTLFVYDDGLYLTEAQLEQAVGLAGTSIIAIPTFGELQAVAPEVAQAGSAPGPIEADCDLPAVRNAGVVSGESAGYRVVDDTPGIVECLGSGDAVYSLVQLPRGDGTLTVLGADDALTNDLVIQDGNAAFALALLGSQPKLVWYLPGIDDVAAAGPASLGDLTPGWVSPVLILLALTAIAAAVWRGRRFGPLVVENLPVTVRSSETMLGRARLYERSSSRVRALDALRVGAIRRLASLCGQPRTASVEDIIAAVASATGRSLADVRGLLVDQLPGTDRDLIALSDALLVLERDLERAVRP